MCTGHESLPDSKMMFNRAYGFILVIVTLSSVYSDQGLYPSLQPLRQNASRGGICTLEVPTVDLLSSEDRLSGVIPRGNGTRPGFSKIEICCSGWAVKSHAHFECEPVCDNGCINGNCTAPNVCSCKRGYIKNNIGECIPTCPTGCLNGVCTHTGQCSCNAGHQQSLDRKYCIPICTGGCGQGGDCLGANACKCRPGYTLNRNTNKCEYNCEGGCGAGTCIGPNQCSCPPGFKLVGSSCVAECPRGCTNGVCTGPNVCTCQPGWHLDQSGTKCDAHCRDPCLNADCTAPDTCTCKKGYVNDPNSPVRNKCVAHCPGGCENGSCSAPNFCICNPGFIKEGQGSSRCVRRLKRSSGGLHYELIPSQLAF